jgi:L-iditol 2-dehydrogenase
VKAITEGKGAHVVVDTAAAVVTVKQTVDVLRIGGTIVLVGMTPKDEVEFNFMKLMGKEGVLKTIFRYRNLYPVAINAIASGAINVKSIVSHEFDFENTKEAFDFVVNNARDVVKAVIKIK